MYSFYWEMFNTLCTNMNSFFKTKIMLILFSEDRSVLVNSEDPDEMPPYAAFHQGLHCLPKKSF